MKVPGDAILVPYDPKAEHGVEDATRLLVPYDKYVELWNRAYPDKKLEAAPPPASYALAGASYTATLGIGKETSVAAFAPRKTHDDQRFAATANIPWA